MTMLIKCGTVPRRKSRRRENILIEGTRIRSFPEDVEGISSDEVIDGKGMLALPGLINTHTHVAMTLFRSYADDLALMDWLQNMIWPAEAHLDDDIVYWGSMLAFAEMIRGGTTAFCDMYMFMESCAKAAEKRESAAISHGGWPVLRLTGKRRWKRISACIKTGIMPATDASASCSVRMRPIPVLRNI